MTRFLSKEVNELIKSNLNKILNYFDISLYSNNKKYYGNCPIHHGSDNNNALLLYKNTGIWMCTTHHCEKIFGRTPSGFIKALISTKRNGWSDESDKDKVASDAEAHDFISKFFSNSVEKLEVKKPEKYNYDKLNFIRQVNLLIPAKVLNTRENLRKILKLPSEYYLNRGFSEAILDKYDVGLLNKPGHQFHERTVVPIYDINYQYIIAYTTRSLHSKCLVCGYFHDLNKVCPNKLEDNNLSKWQHSYGFKKEQFLYNYWFAKNVESKKLILVEGPSHCWRVAEAGYFNSVAYMGSSISPFQINLIKRLGVDEIIIPADNDAAGELIREQIRASLGKTYKYKDIYLETNDIAELSIEEVKDAIST